MTNFTRFLLDENLQTKDDDPNKDDEDFLTVNLKDILPIGTPDRTVLKYARDLGFIIVTKDIKLALNAIIMDQPVVFIDPNGNRFYLERNNIE